jgi:hypothetical protein
MSQICQIFENKAQNLRIIAVWPHPNPKRRVSSITGKLFLGVDWPCRPRKRWLGLQWSMRINFGNTAIATGLVLGPAATEVTA